MTSCQQTTKNLVDNFAESSSSSEAEKKKALVLLEKQFARHSEAEGIEYAKELIGMKLIKMLRDVLLGQRKTGPWAALHTVALNVVNNVVSRCITDDMLTAFMDSFSALDFVCLLKTATSNEVITQVVWILENIAMDLKGPHRDALIEAGAVSALIEVLISQDSKAVQERASSVFHWLTTNNGVEVDKHSAVVTLMVPILSTTFITENRNVQTRLNCGYSLISLLDNKDQDDSIVGLAINKSQLLRRTVQMATTQDGELQSTALNVLLSLCDKASENQLDEIVNQTLLSALKILVEDTTSPDIALTACETISQICAGGSSEVLTELDCSQLMVILIQLSRNAETDASVKKAATEAVLFYFHSSTISQALTHIDRGAMEIVSNILLLPVADDLVKEALLVLQLLLGTAKFVTILDFEKVVKSLDHEDTWARLTALIKEDATDGNNHKLAEMLVNKDRLRATMVDFEAGEAATIKQVEDVPTKKKAKIL